MELFRNLLIILSSLFTALLPTQTTIQVEIPSQSFESIIPTPIPLPDSYIIPEQLHVFQTFNNCGPATLSMALSYLGQSVSQAELGQQLRPYQVPGGDNDDKNVSLYEVVDEAKRRGFVGYVRPNGTIIMLKKLLAADIVVITRTWLGINDDIGHFRVIRGYDDLSAELIQDDSYQGKNLRYAYRDFELLWRTFNYEYAVIVPPEKQAMVEKLLGQDLDERFAWNEAKKRIENELVQEPQHWHLQFALSRIHYYLGEHQQSLEVFRRVQPFLSFRTLWYQPEPLYAMYELGLYDELLPLTQSVLSNHNRAYSELYYLRGNVYKKKGEIETARIEYEKAIQYNRNELLYQQAIQSL